MGSKVDEAIAAREEIAARLAVAGVDAEVIRAGGSPKEADAVAAAFRFYLLGNVPKAQDTLLSAFSADMAKGILTKFSEGAKAA